MTKMPLTLKEMLDKPKKRDHPKVETICLVCLNNLAQDWIKWLDSNIDITEVYVKETNSSDIQYAKRLCERRIFLRDWIKMFFDFEKKVE